MRISILLRSKALATFLALLALTLTVSVSGAEAQEQPESAVPHVWVYSGTQSFRHGHIDHAKEVIAQWAEETGAFTAEFTEDPEDLTAEMLARTDITLWLSPSGIAESDFFADQQAPFSPEQREMLVSWVSCGGGFIAVHQATDSYDDWPEWDELVGAKMSGHQVTGGSASTGTVPDGDVATLYVNDQSHPANAPWHGQESFDLDEELYYWSDGMTPDLLTTDFNQLIGMGSFINPLSEAAWGSMYAENQALAWTSSFRGQNRSFQTNLGHRPETWDTPEYQAHVVNGIGWVAEVRPGDTCPGEIPQIPSAPLRIDGGSAADPVGQAVATSQETFDDGTGELVVLATADRFPDALAGAALAGTRGPLLLTPYADELDPAVAAEIARVTAGKGAVLVLGGEAAVSTGAAEQAQEAAGTDGTDCQAPYPASCRYAGIGREDTAALIAMTVVVRDQPTRALLARGDAFADAITGGAYAANAGVPILLTPSDALNAQTRAFLENNPSITEVVVLGGTDAVSDAAMQDVPVADRRRVAGQDRTGTAAAIAIELWQADGLPVTGVTIVNVYADDGWQTALAAAVTSARINAPQLGVDSPPAVPSDSTKDAAALLGGPVLVAGGHDLVSGQQVTDLISSE